MQVLLPKDVRKIIEVLEGAGYEAYAVGGCVRDSILGRIPDDWDITTSAKPLETKGLFKRTIDTGLQHGTVTILLDGNGYEVTTYRIDGEYTDNRHPKEVTFTANLIEDLKRRDFTINAMAYNDSEGLVDAFDGLVDLEKKVIRCVGQASERFTEDALRILRAVRFSAQLGFQIEKSTREGAAALAETLSQISAERIQVEMVKLLVSSHPAYLKTAWVMGITTVIMPEFDRMMETEQNNPHHNDTVGEHAIKAMEAVEPDKVLRLAALLHDVGKPLVKSTDNQGVDHFYKHEDDGARLAEAILKRWRFDNDTLIKVKKLVLFHNQRFGLTPASVRKAVYRVGEDIFPMLLQLQRADILAQSPQGQEEKLRKLAAVQRLYKEILAQKECLSLKDLAVTGRDLIADGMKPGKEIGQVLEALLDHVLQEPQHNSKENLLEYSREFRN